MTTFSRIFKWPVGIWVICCIITSTQGAPGSSPKTSPPLIRPIAAPIAFSKYTLHPNTKEKLNPASATPEKIARTYIEQELKFPASEYRIQSKVTSNAGVASIYVRQVLHGLEVVNADININILCVSSYSLYYVGNPTTETALPNCTKFQQSNGN
jgi:extracellular elastinolytic metalloproteinase